MNVELHVKFENISQRRAIAVEKFNRPDRG